MPDCKWMASPGRTVGATRFARGAIKEPAAMSGFIAKLPAATYGSEDTSLACDLLLLVAARVLRRGG